MNPKWYHLWLRNRKLDVQQDIVLEAKDYSSARELARQIISDEWKVVSVELFDQD